MKPKIINRTLLTLLAVPALLVCSRTIGAVVPDSDRLVVNYGGVKVDISAPEANPEKVLEANNGGNPWLPKSGYILIFEPDGKTLSDILISYTGSSLQLFSDGSLGFPLVDDLKKLQLAELGRFTETKNGIDINVGNLFGTANTPIPAAAIRVISDGDAAVPEPSTYLAGLSALGALVFGWRNRK